MASGEQLKALLKSHADGRRAHAERVEILAQRLAWVDGLAQGPVLLTSGSRRSRRFGSRVVTGEIRQGIERLRRRDSRQAEIFERWLEHVVTSYADRVLPIDGRVADAWGRLGAVHPVPVIDGLLAATARVHVPLATLDARLSQAPGPGCGFLRPDPGPASSVEPP